MNVFEKTPNKTNHVSNYKMNAKIMKIFGSQLCIIQAPIIRNCINHPAKKIVYFDSRLRCLSVMTRLGLLQEARRHHHHYPPHHHHRHHHHHHLRPHPQHHHHQHLGWVLVMTRLCLPLSWKPGLRFPGPFNSLITTASYHHHHHHHHHKRKRRV